MSSKLRKCGTFFRWKRSRPINYTILPLKDASIASRRDRNEHKVTGGGVRAINKTPTSEVDTVTEVLFLLLFSLWFSSSDHDYFKLLQKEMNFHSMFRDFNPGKFIVWVCVAVFTALLALRLDEEIDWNYWVVFSPIWFWKGLVIFGALVGNIVWWKNPHYRLEGQSYIQYRALLISLGLHLFLLMFEVLVADNLENRRHAWVSVFAPLVLISMVSIAACIWAVKHDRSFELELFCSVNLLQFIFIALRLDEHILWPWEVVFVPAWILLCVSVVAVLYSIIFVGLLMRMPDVNPDRRRTSMNSAVGYTCLVTPLLVFLIMLASKLNRTTSASYTLIVTPLYISFLTLIFMAFTTKRANQWWFGLRKDVCPFLLGVCPLLQEYANISYSFRPPTPSTRESSEGGDSSAEKKEGHGASRKDQKVVAPSYSLEVPD